ncbi:transposase [Streptomyces phaeoluteigriseus]|uniref:Transposase n=1 Tax=Streptomyces phaeoluteigriseus TaxID=114686 RepID=A0ABY4ZBN3_9ACTN|nr:transposase [Streptomyces phaeoluteigriseus]USQ85925.1 transposase [Streptomyces phaeoluteigriseus]
MICDGRGTPLKVITIAANVNDVTQTLALVDGIPSVAGRPGRPRRRPDALLGDKGYDSHPHREELRKRRILPVISRKGAPNIKGLGKLRYVVEQTHQGRDVGQGTPSQRVPDQTACCLSSSVGEGAAGDERWRPGWWRSSPGRPARRPVPGAAGDRRPGPSRQV